MAVPIALESLFGVVLELHFEEIHELRVGLFDLLAGRPTVVGEIKAALKLQGPVNNAAKILLGLFDRFGRMIDVQVKNNAGKILFGPR